MATITLGRYLWERIHEIGVDTIFGVPGDFNLQLLDYVFEVKGLNWVGNQNELNAAYAADGYARVKEVPGAFVTTHGVGELSALNGVAGALSERVKLIHVVGQTTRPMQDNHLMIHHSIGDKPDHQLYNKTSKHLRAAAAELWDVKTAPKEIDRVIRECFIHSSPVYIFVPLDMVGEEVPAALLETPIDTSMPVDTKAQDAAVNAIKEALENAKRPSILVDAFVQRFSVVSETKALVDRLGVPVFTTNSGKSIIDETHPQYVGVYNGQISSPRVAQACESSDLVLILGYMPADTNSGGFSRKLSEYQCIAINPHDVNVKGKAYPDTFIKPLIAQLAAVLNERASNEAQTPKLPPPFRYKDHAATNITQSWIWPRFAEYFRGGDVVIGETGTTNFGLCDIKFPANIQYVNQIYYGSIGWATGALLGVEVARAEVQAKQNQSPGRTILITGDGSLALTMQEIGTVVKQKLKRPIIFIINNNGYTIERMIWGARQTYNDIVQTDYSALLPLFKHPDPASSFHRATTKMELDEILKKVELTDPTQLQIVELIVDQLDTPWRLGAQLAVRGEVTQKYLADEGFVDSIGGWGLEGSSLSVGPKWA
ncbi:pyruvate decarboxylase-like protein [Mytilinidion resinicola]|uniref:Pyruvate decarboxylase n=1 Tax=Mytilinidion resinicola TaxID=574789 RepID=A0A6A6Z8T3_9PEZI|nr:pyruvate decarboxylase-like protein [Mytilinidion resinicola]KAF2817531.1 pyruvate decarboxylase-like protein [Mytilinidion resinicola]